MKMLGVGVAALILGIVLGNQLPRHQIFSTLPTPLASHSWKEPDSFIGIKFYTDLTKSLKECQKDGYGYKTFDDSKGPCWEFHDKYYKIRYTDLFYEVYAYMVDRKLAYLDADFHWELFPRTLAVFKERYGEPTSLVTEQWKSMGGITVPNEIATWEGKQVSISLRQHGGKIDRARGEYVTPLWREYSAKTGDEWAKKKAKGL